MFRFRGKILKWNEESYIWRQGAGKKVCIINQNILHEITFAFRSLLHIYLDFCGENFAWNMLCYQLRLDKYWQFLFDLSARRMKMESWQATFSSSQRVNEHSLRLINWHKLIFYDGIESIVIRMCCDCEKKISKVR